MKQIKIWSELHEYIPILHDKCLSIEQNGIFFCSYTLDFRLADE